MFDKSFPVGPLELAGLDDLAAVFLQLFKRGKRHGEFFS
jgi:hypothetical protein